jgi:hypothetical protein
MRFSLLLASAVASVGLVLLASWAFDMSFERAAILAPVIVVSFGAAAALVVLWTRIALEPLRRRRQQQ